MSLWRRIPRPLSQLDHIWTSSSPSRSKNQNGGDFKNTLPFFVFLAATQMEVKEVGDGCAPRQPPKTQAVVGFPLQFLTTILLILLYLLIVITTSNLHSDNHLKSSANCRSPLSLWSSLWVFVCFLFLVFSTSNIVRGGGGSSKSGDGDGGRWLADDLVDSDWTVTVNDGYVGESEGEGALIIIIFNWKS